MPSLAGPPAARPGDVAGVLRLLVYLVLALVVMVLDHRGGWLATARARAEVAVQPVWWLAQLPSRIGVAVSEDAALRSQLARENRALRNALLVTGARNARLQAAAVENVRLRALLGGVERNRLDVQLASILDIDLDPTRQRLVLDAGQRDGVQVGQAVIDAGGLMGQVIHTTPATATVLLVTDPDHAVPAVTARSGARVMVHGGGRSDLLRAADIPLSADVREGDVLLTSGLGGRFPAGFPVGVLGVLRAQPLTIDTEALAPMRLAPAAFIFWASSQVLTPPDALTPMSGPTSLRMSAMSSTVAPPGPKPVEVFTKCAPATLDSEIAITFSSWVSAPVSRMTFTLAGRDASTTFWMSS